MTQLSFFDAPPAVRSSPTSVAAAESMVPHVANAEAIVLAIIREASDGLIDEQIIERAVRMGMSPNGPRARRVGLVAKGLVRDSGRVRETKAGRMAVVWEVV